MGFAGRGGPRGPLILDRDYGPQPLLRTGLLARCPRCGEGPLFKGFLDVAPSCASCGLDYAKVDSGDGPAVFVILILGFIVVFLALWVELKYEPPTWVHLVLWVPLILVGVLGMLRPFKATLVALQYRHKATQEIELD